MSARLVKFVRHNAIALVALFIALGGTSYAAVSLPAKSVGTTQLKDGAVTTVKLGKTAVTTGKIRAAAVTGSKVASDALTGANILESSLAKVPLAAAADHATSADTATDASTLGGIGPSVFGTSMMYAGCTFQPRSSTNAWTYGSSGGIQDNGTAGNFVAAVTLPQGASVIRLTMYTHSSSAATAGSLFLTKYDLRGNLVDVTVVNSPATIGFNSASADVSPADVIDNGAWAYVLVWSGPANTNAFLGAKIDYTLQ